MYTAILEQAPITIGVPVNGKQGVINMQLRLKIAVVICALIGAHFIYSFFSYEDKAIVHMNTWSHDTPYEVIDVFPKDAPLPLQGKLGAFYTCMQSYAGIGERKLTTPITEVEERLEIQVGDTEINFGVNGVEAYRFIFNINLLQFI